MSDELFGHYRLGDIIGRGNVSEVHRAVDVRKERTVAVKLLRPELAADVGFPDRFRHEAALAAGLAAPHVIPIHDYGNIDATFYVEMPLVDGPDLATVLAERGPLEPDVAVRIVSQVADALDAGHAAGLVHGDVKPSNILLTGRTLDFAYLTDFGLARSWTGTPEQDHEADIHALADVLLVALGGSLAVPAALQAVVARGTATEPTDRFGTARELADAARAALGPPFDQQTDPAIPEPTLPPIDPETEVAIVAAPHSHNAGSTGPRPRPARRTISTGKALFIAGAVAVLAVAGTLGITAARGVVSAAPAAPPPPPPRLAPVLAATLPIAPNAGQALVSNDSKRVLLPNGTGLAVIDATSAPGTAAAMTNAPLPDERASAPSAFTHSAGILSPDGSRAYLPVVKPDGTAGLNVLDTATMKVTGFLRYATTAAISIGLDISPDGTTLYASVAEVATQPLGTVIKVIDTGSGAVTKEIPAGAGYAGIRLVTPGVAAYVMRLPLRGGTAHPTAAAVDLRQGTIGADLPVVLPIGMALTADRTVAYVSVNGGFAVLDTASNAVRRIVPITSSRALTAALTPDDRTLVYTTSAGVSVLDIASGVVTGSAAHTFDGISGPVSISPDGRRAYIVDPTADALLVIDLVPAP